MFAVCGLDDGIRVHSITFTMDAYNAGFEAGPTPSPVLTVKVTGNQVVYSANITGLSSVELSPYDETTKHITDIVFKSYIGWNSYY
jgi:hypothetical protein